MDFCVRCGKKEIYQEYLCEECYLKLHPPKEPKLKAKQLRKPEEPRRREYFEGDVQLRNVEQEVIDFSIKWLEHKKVDIPKMLWHKNGADIYVSDRRAAKKLGLELQEKFGGMIKLTATLFTFDNQSAKDVYRVTMLFKQFPYSKGDSITFKGKTYIVRAAKKDVFVENDQTKEMKHIRYADLEKSRLF